MEETCQLVSICIITYNSSKTVVETLNSAFSQTYPRLELIISDDCSTDNTVEICQKWLSEHKYRFENTRLIVRDKNGGVGKNMNTAIKASSGEWIKPLAGDDLFQLNCISDNIDYVRHFPDVGIAFSKARVFKSINGDRIYTEEFLACDSLLEKDNMSAEEQYKLLLYYNFVPAVTLFLRSDFAFAHPIPENYLYIEDWPNWLQLTSKGIKLHFFDKETVLYRMDDSLSHPSNSRFVNANFFESYKAFFYSERYPVLHTIDPSMANRLRKEFLIGEIAVVILHNRRNIINRGILLLFKWILGIRKIHYFQ